MNQPMLYESILDNIQDAVYVLDGKGNYVYVNSAYMKLLNISKTELLTYNAHHFLHTGQINICVSDIVYKEKRRVVMFQDVYDTQGRGHGMLQMIIVSTPVFDEKGEVQNVVAVLKELAQISDDYAEAGRNSLVLRFSTQTIVNDRLEGGKVIAQSPAMRRVLELAANVAAADTNVLISGESGTGKEVIAQYIHDASERREKPFVVINCASLPEALLEAELFGYEKGAFTGASSTGKPGQFEMADGGTLFLDEINSLPLNLQGKLLRAIETKVIQRVGSTKNRRVDFRLLSATNEDLDGLMRERKFRIDLFYRLNVIPIDVPPLRHRTEDVVPLALHFLKYYCIKNNKMKSFSPRTLENIQNYDWPGNVRELKNFVERSVVMSFNEIIEIPSVAAIVSRSSLAEPQMELEPLFAEPAPSVPAPSVYNTMLQNGVTLEEYLDDCERKYVEYALEKYKSSYGAAKALGTSQTSVMRRKKKFGI